MTCLLPQNHSPAGLTDLLQAAVDDRAKQGGGTVRVGPGLWSIRTLRLRSGVRLHLEYGCVLQADHDLAAYPAMPMEVSNKDQQPTHLLHAADCEEIAITGPGVIDGQDTAFWRPCRNEAERPYGIFRFVAEGRRPLPLVQLVRCRGIRIENITLRRSPGWTLHAFDCDDVRIRDVRIRNHLFGPNTDGIGITDCRDVVISGCDVTTGDDAIVIKSTHPDKSCERVIVSDCIAETNCAAFALGAEVAGAIREVAFANCIARASLRIIQIELWLPGLVENVTFQSITGRTFPGEGVHGERAIYVDIQQFDRPTPTLGTVRNIRFADLFCTTRGRILITAQDGSHITNVTLRDVHLDIPEIEDPAEVVPGSRSLQMSNFSPQTRAVRAGAVFDNVKGLRLENLSICWPEVPKIPMHAICLRQTESVSMDPGGFAASDPELPAILHL